MSEMQATPLMRLVEETFAEEGEVFDVALYIVSANAVTDAAQQGIMGKFTEVRGLPPQALELAYKYDSALTENKFFLKHYSVIRSFTIMDKIKAVASIQLARLGEAKDDKDSIRALEHMTYSKMDSLVILAFLWKGYDFAVDFAAKLRRVYDVPPEMKEYFKQCLG